MPMGHKRGFFAQTDQARCGDFICPGDTSISIDFIAMKKKAGLFLRSFSVSHKKPLLRQWIETYLILVKDNHNQNRRCPAPC